MAPLAKSVLKDGQEVLDLTQDSDATDSVSSEDEDLKRAIALSLAESAPSPSKPALNTNIPERTIPPKPIPSSSSSVGGMLGLNRQQMEIERLARLKRKREGDDAVSPPPVARRTKSPPAKTSQEMSKKQPPTSNPPLRPNVSAQVPVFSSSPTKSAATPIQYPHGVVKRTWLESHPRTPDTITLSELLSAPTLNSAFLSSYIWDFDWLLPHFATKSTSFLLVMHSHSALHRSQLQGDFAGIPNVRLCFPPMDGVVNCMHSKLMLLFYDEYMRIAVPTANLVGFDWGEGGVMENSVFIIDLPKLKSPQTLSSCSSSSAPKSPPFLISLLSFLTAQTVPDAIITKLLSFDFTATQTANIGFAHSIGGSHTSDTIWRTTGHPGLGRLVTQLGLQPPVVAAAPSTITIDYLTSSVGSLTDEFLRSIYLAASGDDGLTELGLRKDIHSKGKGGTNTTITSSAAAVEKRAKGNITNFLHKRGADHTDDDDNDSSFPAALTGRPDQISKVRPTKKTPSRPFLSPPSAWRSHFRFFFPSHATVAASRAGPAGAGTICFQRRWWDSTTKFPRANMRDCVSVRPGTLMHNKIMFVRYLRGRKVDREGDGWEEEEGEERRRRRQQHQYAGWVYVGSANLSESAWGRLVVDRTKKSNSKKKERTDGENNADSGAGVKLNCRNWECGVILPVPVPAPLGNKEAGGVMIDKKNNDDDDDDDEEEEEEGSRALQVFERVLPVPMRYPATRYVGEMEPWFFGQD